MNQHLYVYGGQSPMVDDTVFLAPGSRVVGRVKIGALSSVWYNVVIRGDVDLVDIGRLTNIQDGSVLHEDAGYPLVIGDGVTVGHNVILHGCRIGDGAVIGMGAIVMSGAKIGANSVLAAGSLLPQGKEIPPNSLAMGTPAQVVRELSQQERAHFAQLATRYQERALFYKNGGKNPDF